MRITTLGACGGEVTGSGYLVETSSARVLVDFGAFQGGAALDPRNASVDGVNPEALDSVVLTHAHLDHCGRLPLLVRRNASPPIFATPATLDFMHLLLSDAAKVQDSDVQRENRKRALAGKPPVRPAYVPEDVDKVVALGRGVKYNETREVAQGITVRFVDAGHILGSASVEMKVRDRGTEKTVVFSGDIGQWGTPILRDPTPPEAADLVFLESTYGDRDHRDHDATMTEFRELLREAIWNREKVLVPAFAIGRTQQVLYAIAELVNSGTLPDVPIYLDSPMASKATALYRKHCELFDAAAREMMTSGLLHGGLRNLRIVESPAESRELNDRMESSVIIAAGGMCEGGRIVHHLRHNVWRRGVTVMIVGFQARGTLGRELVEGRRQAFIFGKPVPVRAKIKTLGGFSAHAGKTDLLRWMEPVAAHSPRVVLTHGEDPQRRALAAALKERWNLDSRLPAIGDTIEL